MPFVISNRIYFLHKYFHVLEYEYLEILGLANLVGVKQLELLDTFVVVVLDTNASAAFLDVALRSPKMDIYRIGTVEN